MLRLIGRVASVVLTATAVAIGVLLISFFSLVATGGFTVAGNIVLLVAVMIFQVAVLTRGTEQTGIRPRLWHSPFLIALAVQLGTEVLALGTFDSSWRTWDCVKTDERMLFVEDLGAMAATAFYRCDGSQLLSAAWPGLLCLGALPFALLRGPTRIAALTALVLGLAPVVYLAVWFASSDISMTVRHFLSFPDEVEVHGYEGVVLRFWLLTLAVYLAFWAWNGREWIRARVAGLTRLAPTGSRGD